MNESITSVWQLQYIEVEVKINTANQVSFGKNPYMHALKPKSSSLQKMMHKKLVLIILSQSLFELLLKRPALFATAEHTLQTVEEACRNKTFSWQKTKLHGR